ncbi:MAG: SIR2 family protein [Bacteroidota bacterium]
MKPIKDQPPIHISQKRLVRMFKDIKRLGTEESRFCFLLGAGASKSSGIKTGWELSKEWYEDLKDDLLEEDRKTWEEMVGLDPENIGASYSHLYQKRYEVSPQVGYEEFKKLMERAEPGIGYVILSQILANEKHNFVITTNFDYLIEDSVRLYTSTKPFTAGHETLAEFVSSQTERPTIIKVHRDLFLHPFNDEEETNRLKIEWENALKPILKNFNLIVVGYGGNDGSLMDYLQDISAENRKAIYWCIRNEGELNDKINALLTKKDFTVEIEGFDELMIALNDALGYDVFEKLDTPEEHPFVLSAKQRITDLNEKRKALLDKLTKNKQEISKETKEIFGGAYNYLIDAYNEKNTAKADKIYEDGLNKYPEDENLLREYALFLSDELKNLDKAEEYYKKGLILYPNNIEILGNYAIFLTDVRKNHEKAEEYFKKALSLKPDDLYNMGNYADFLTDIRKDYDQAEEYYKKAVLLDPNFDGNTSAYATFLSDIRKDYDKADTFFKKTLSLNSSDPDHNGNYAHHLIISKQDYTQAEKFIDKAIDLASSTDDDLRAELWFYRYAHYKKWLEKAEAELEKLIVQGVKSVGWNFQAHIDIAEKNNHPNIKKLKGFADALGKE